MTLSRIRAARLVFIIVAAAAIAASAAPPSLAQVPAGNAAMAEALFREGQRLMFEKRYPEACPKLAESHRLDPAGGTLLTLAFCHEAEGRTATAWTEFREAEAVALREGRRDRQAAAREKADALEPRLSRLVIQPAPESPPTDRGENGDPSASLLVRRAELADKFKNQDRDPRWTPTAERTLRGEVRNLVSDSKRVLALECGSSMCRIDAEFSSAEDYNEFWTNLFLHRDDERLKDIYGGFEIPESEKHEDGSYRVRAYMMRAPAGPLPNPPPP